MSAPPLAGGVVPGIQLSCTASRYHGQSKVLLDDARKAGIERTLTVLLREAHLEPDRNTFKVRITNHTNGHGAAPKPVVYGFVAYPDAVRFMFRPEGKPGKGVYTCQLAIEKHRIQAVRTNLAAAAERLFGHAKETTAPRRTPDRTDAELALMAVETVAGYHFAGDRRQWVQAVADEAGTEDGVEFWQAALGTAVSLGLVVELPDGGYAAPPMPGDPMAGVTVAALPAPQPVPASPPPAPTPVPAACPTPAAVSPPPVAVPVVAPPQPDPTPAWSPDALLDRFDDIQLALAEVAKLRAQRAEAAVARDRAKATYDAAVRSYEDIERRMRAAAAEATADLTAAARPPT